MKIGIFTEASKQIGYGHIYRCLGIKEALLNEGIDSEIFVYNPDNLNFPFEIIDINWFGNLSNISDNHSLKARIFDSYKIDRVFIEKNSNIKIKDLYIDDIAQVEYKHGVVVNGSLGARNLNYKKEKDLRFLLGPEYSFLRKEFWQNEQKKIRENIKNVLIIMGGSDIRGLNKKLIELFKNRDLDIHVITKEKSYNNNKKIKFHKSLDASQIKDLMVKSDLAIIGAGQTVYECMAVGIPFIPIRIIDNQDSNVNGLISYELFVRVINWDDKDFSDNILKTFFKFAEKRKREEFSKKIQNIVDGKGNLRIANHIKRMIKS